MYYWYHISTCLAEICLLLTTSTLVTVVRTCTGTLVVYEVNVLAGSSIRTWTTVAGKVLLCNSNVHRLFSLIKQYITASG